jgi:hypothetical protein
VVAGPDADKVLKALASRLQPISDDVSICGTGRAKFLYAVQGRRAVEASIDEHGSIWVEYWSDRLSEHAPAAKEATLATIEAVESSIADWFKKR